MVQEKYETDEADWDWISDQFKAVRQDMIIQVPNCLTLFQIMPRNFRAVT